MSAARRLVVFAALVVVAFAGGAGLGALLGPIDAGEVEHHETPGDHSPEHTSPDRQVHAP